MTWNVDKVLTDLLENGSQLLQAPTYSGAKDNGIMMAIESMKNHTTDEGWQIASGLQFAGYTLCGKNLKINTTATEEILQRTSPGIVVLQDKREWDVGRKDFRPSNARFSNVEHLANQPSIFKLTILKDAHHRQEYHRQSAKEIDCHAWIIYYHPAIVKRLAPYVRSRHLIRTYHSLDSTIVPEYSFRRNKEILLSGAISNYYPLRKRLAQDFQAEIDVLKHPGYHIRGCHTPNFLKLLSEYKVSICTSSFMGYTLRKLMESTACGCRVLTDLPSDEILPEIDDNLERIHPQTPSKEVREKLLDLAATYNPERQKYFAEKAKRFYDYRAIGKRLAIDIENTRANYG